MSKASAIAACAHAGPATNPTTVENGEKLPGMHVRRGFQFIFKYYHLPAFHNVLVQYTKVLRSVLLVYGRPLHLYCFVISIHHDQCCVILEIVFEKECVLDDRAVIILGLWMMACLLTLLFSK